MQIRVESVTVDDEQVTFTHRNPWDSMTLETEQTDVKDYATSHISEMHARIAEQLDSSSGGAFEVLY